MKDPIARIYTGKRGRPARTTTKAAKAIRNALLDGFDSFGLASPWMPEKAKRNAARQMAARILISMEKANVSLIPTPLAAEMALLLKQPVPAAHSLAPMMGAKEITTK